MDLKGTITSFADDTVIFYKSDCWANLKRMAETEFFLIKKWFACNKLTLNIDKTYYLPFASYSSTLPDMGNLKIDDMTEIPEAQYAKYLGIIIDKNLRWDLQINNIAKKLRGLISRFKFLKGFLSIPHLKTVYFALVQSQLSYGILGWGGVYDNHLEKINILQIGY